MADPSQLEDRIVLRMLAMRADGKRPIDVAAWFGWSTSRVVRVTDEVLAADLAESGEARDVVLAGYWGGS
jgi:hypothetical protein